MGLEREQRKIYVDVVGITISLFWEEKCLKSLRTVSSSAWWPEKQSLAGGFIQRVTFMLTLLISLPHSITIRDDSERAKWKERLDEKWI